MKRCGVMAGATQTCARFASLPPCLPLFLQIDWLSDKTCDYIDLGVGPHSPICPSLPFPQSFTWN